MSNAETHRELHDLFNGRDFDAMVKRFADGFRYTDRARGLGIVGADGFKEWLKEWTRSMSNARVTEATYIDGGDTSVALFQGRGLHDGQLGPLPPSGRELSFPLCEILRYDADGNVTGGELYYELNDLLQQAANPRLVVRPPAQGDAFWMLGGLYEVLSSSAETGGAATVMQMTMPVGMGPPPHRHNGLEILHVLEGTIRHHLGNQTVEAGPGTTFTIPAGTLEFFEPLTTTRVIITYLPGGIDAFFAEAGERAPRREIPPAPTSPPDIDRLVSLARLHGLEIVPPAH